MHRLYSLGHDPLLGFVVGVGDILNGTITTVDKTGNVVVQQIGRYTDRKASTVAEALIRQFIHLKTDVNTAMGLPAPLMGLFNIMQFGELGTEKQTVAEIVQGMYYEATTSNTSARRASPPCSPRSRCESHTSPNESMRGIA